jgi:hypothetical protein
MGRFLLPAMTPAASGTGFAGIACREGDDDSPTVLKIVVHKITL